jgi:cytochrome c1
MRRWQALAAILLTVAVAVAACSEEKTPRITAAGNPELGQRAIRRYGCGSCHTIPGVKGATALAAPPLIHFSKRQFIAGRLPNNEENLIRWVMNPQDVEPGTAMPTLGVSDQDARNIAAYLLSIK